MNATADRPAMANQIATLRSARFSARVPSTAQRLRRNATSTPSRLVPSSTNSSRLSAANSSSVYFLSGFTPSALVPSVLSASLRPESPSLMI
ncbi:unannotated protein [freshwater metagenome]|uniref:Unannotated protein n=1 Tax=freshwater metagenome TaxID=449393 RepID=A0A6J7G9U0_9ZZZZ